MGDYMERKNDMNKCKKCGGYYDAGEICTCEERHVPTKRNMTSEELRDFLLKKSYEEYNAYCKSNMEQMYKRRSRA